jgi:hypothetical protein
VKPSAPTLDRIALASYIPRELGCDFCNLTEPGAKLVAFPCATFTHRTFKLDGIVVITCRCHGGPIFENPPAGQQVFEMEVRAEWLACCACARSARAVDGKALARRSARRYGELRRDLKLDPKWTERTVGQLQRGYWLHRLPMN